MSVEEMPVFKASGSPNCGRTTIESISIHNFDLKIDFLLFRVHTQLYSIINSKLKSILSHEDSIKK